MALVTCYISYNYVSHSHKYLALSDSSGHITLDEKTHCADGQNEELVLKINSA